MAARRDVVIGTYPQKVPAELAGLHLEDAGVSYHVRAHQGRWQLVVDSDDAMMARLVSGTGLWADGDPPARPYHSALVWLVVAALVVSPAAALVRFQ